MKSAINLYGGWRLVTPEFFLFAIISMFFISQINECTRTDRIIREINQVTVKQSNDCYTVNQSLKAGIMKSLQLSHFGRLP